MTKSNIQIRGNCQICGRDHAFIGAKMAQHGYTVEYGFFNGVCDGHKYLPVQKDITKLRQTQEYLRAEGAKNIRQGEALVAGKIKPEFVFRKTYPNGRHRDAVVEQVKWDDCPDRERNEYRRHIGYQAQSQGRAMIDHANYLDMIADKYHGQPMTEVVKEAPKSVTDPINDGEKRKAPNGSIMEVLYVERARVYWKIAIEGRDKPMRGWTSTTAFRKYEKIEG